MSSIHSAAVLVTFLRAFSWTRLVVVSLLGAGVFAGVALTRTHDGPAVVSSVSIVSEDAAGQGVYTVTCASGRSIPSSSRNSVGPFIDAVELETLTSSCQPYSPLVGARVPGEEGPIELDSDGDGEAEYNCSETTLVFDLDSVRVRSCVALGPSPGNPSADTLRTPSGAIVERIDIDGNAKADYLLVDGQLTAIPPPAGPWWLAVAATLGVGLIGALGQLAAAVVGTVLTRNVLSRGEAASGMTTTVGDAPAKQRRRSRGSA